MKHRSLSRTVTWALFALVIVLILPDVLEFWVNLPGGGNTAFIIAFTLFSLFHCGLTLGGRRLAAFFGLTVLISFINEEVGVHTGLIFGAYHYSDMLGPKLDQVPILIPLGWFMMIYASWVVAQALLRGKDVHRLMPAVALVVFAAFAMTGWDMAMDPPVAAHGNWIWEQGGPYFGVPLHNFFGWGLNAFLIYLAFYAVDRWSGRPDAGTYTFGSAFAALPVILYLVFSLEYLAPSRQPALLLIGIFTMFMQGALALAQLLLPRARDEADRESCSNTVSPRLDIGVPAGQKLEFARHHDRPTVLVTIGTDRPVECSRPPTRYAIATYSPLPFTMVYSVTR